MTEHIFTMTLNWPGGRNAVGELKAERLHTNISIPPEMNGPGVGTNPDEMLLGAAATCYLITLANLLENSSLEVELLCMTSQGFVDVTNNVYTYVRIVHRPLIKLSVTAADRDYRLAQRLAEKAEKTCMISKAVRGNVKIEVEVKIVQDRIGEF